MKGTLVQLTHEGRLNIPKEIIEELNWQIGDYVLIIKEENKIIVHKAKVVIDE